MYRRHFCVALAATTAGCAGWETDGPADQEQNDSTESNQTDQNETESETNQTRNETTPDQENTTDASEPAEDDGDSDESDSGAPSEDDAQEDTQGGSEEPEPSDDPDGSERSDDEQEPEPDAENESVDPEPEPEPDPGPDSNETNDTHTLTVITKDADTGEPVDAVLTVTESGGPERYGRTGPDGRTTMELPNGRHAVRAAPYPDYSPHAAGGVDIDGSDETVVLELTPTRPGGEFWEGNETANETNTTIALVVEAVL